MFWQLAILVGQMWLGEITRPRPKKVSFEDFKKDNAPSEMRPVCYLAGQVEVTPSRIWFGDFRQRAVERDSHWTDYIWAGALAFLLDTITVGYRYYVGEAFVLCFGPDTHIDQIKLHDRLVYDSGGVDNAGGSFLIDDPQAWGGDQPPGEGGQYSWVQITRGNYTDPTNAYLESLLSTPPNKTPSLRGISALVSVGPSGATESGYFAAGGVGFTPHFREWKVVCRRQPNHLATAYSRIGVNANPMEVIYEHATSLEYGARLPLTEINMPSFRSVAQQLHGESLGWSGKIENPTSPMAVVENVLAQIDGVLDPSPSLGLTARLVRRDYSFATLPVLNQSNITEIDRYLPGAYEDTANKVIVPFADQNNNFAVRPGIYIDPANQRIQDGRIVPKTQDYIGVGDYATANLLATRDGRALALPRPPLLCSVLPSFGRLRYRGEVLKFEWRNPTFSKVMRVLAITKGNVSDPDYKLEMIEDQFATGIRTSGEPVGTGHSDPAVGLDTAPPSASWNTACPPDGLTLTLVLTNTNQFEPVIEGCVIFGSYAPGGQYGRIWVTEPGGVQTLSPIYLAPDGDNEATFRWPAKAVGTYQFCVQTYSLHSVTNGAKVCATIAVANIGSPSVSPSHSVSPSTSPSISPSSSISPSASASASLSASASQSGSTSPSASLSPSSSASPSGVDGPDSIGDLQLWLKADSLALNDGDQVSTWTDSSGNGRDGTRDGGTAGYPKYSAAGGPNSKPAIRPYLAGSDGSSFTLPNFLTGYPSGHGFVVAKLDTEVSDVPCPFPDWGTAGDSYYPYSGDSKIYDDFGSTVRKTTVNPAPALTNWVLYEDRTASGAWSNRLDGTELFATASNTVAFTTAPRIGKSASKQFIGLVAEYIFYNRVLDSGETQTIYDYIEDKYGITLP